MSEKRLKNKFPVFGNNFEKAVSKITVRGITANERLEFFSDGKDKKAEYVLQ